MLLSDLASGVVDPQVGIEMVASFYQADGAIFNQCDDSGGDVGNVFRFDAKQLFVSYAVQCPDKKWLSEWVFALNREDDYGIRDILIDCAVEYLPEPMIRHLIKQFQIAAGKETDEYKKRHWLLLVESLARQIKDAPLFEKARIAAWGTLSTAAYVDIAQVYLESGDAKTALSWIGRISLNETYQAAERDQLLDKIYGEIGDRDKQVEVAWRIFRRHRSADRLNDLLAIIGKDQGRAVIEGEVTMILAERILSHTSATFLVEVAEMDAAETYLFDRADQLNGDFYSGLLPLAEVMETTGRHLCASLIYRALLDSILRRGRTKAYPHGVRYLKKLDRFAASVSDWQRIENHTVYTDRLSQKHGRKHSFWSRYKK